jgi:protein-tyrosine phosphatase
MARSGAPIDTPGASIGAPRYRSAMTPSTQLNPSRIDLRHLRLPGTRNLRDVGGYAAAGGRRTRWRTLFRTDALDVIPAASQEALLDLGLRTVIDLRWPHELRASPSAFASSPAVRYRSIPLLEDDPTPVIGLAATYRLMLDERGPQLADVARAVLEPGGLPAVIGCAAGKDRTGVAVALLLAAVGVAADEIVADYVLTGPAFSRPDTGDPHLVDWRAEPIMLECPPAHMEALLAHLAARHGGARALLRRHGLTPGELDLLVERLTEPATD